MEKEFINYSEALALKELGFDEYCFKCKTIGAEHLDYTPSDYDDFPEQKEREVLIPLYQQAFRWFREKYGINVVIDRVTYNEWTYTGYNFNLPKVKEISEEGLWDTYEEAELECLKKLIEIALKK